LATGKVSLKQAITPRGLEHWERSIGFTNRLNIQRLQYNKHLVSVPNKVLNSKRLNSKIESWERKIKHIQETPFYRTVSNNIKDVAWIAEIAGLAEAVDLARNNVDPVTIFGTLDFKFIFISESVEKQRGYTREEALKQKLDDMLTENSILTAMNSIILELKKEASGKYPFDREVVLELEQKCKDGSIMPIEVAISIHRDKTGKPLGLVGISRDISERKQQEGSIQALLDANPDSTFLVSPDGTILAANAVGKKRGKRLSPDIIGANISYVPPNADSKYLEMAAFRTQKLKEALTTKKPVEFEDEYRGKFYEHRIWPVLDKDGNVAQCAVYVRDITDWKIAERTQAETVEQIDSFFKYYQGIGFSGRMDFKAILFKGAVEKITGYTEEEFASGKVKWIEIIHEEDRSKIYADKVSTVPNHLSEREYRIIRKDGELRWVSESIQNMCDASGKPVMVFGSIIDITDRKKAVQEISSMKESTQALLNSSNSSAFLIDPDGIILVANETAAKRGRMPLKDLIGRYAFETREGDLKDYVRLIKERMHQFNRCVVEKAPIKFEDNFDGKYYTHTLQPIFDDRGNVIQVALFVRDITERKQIELLTGAQRDLAVRMLQEKDINEVLSLTVERAIEISGRDSGGVYILNPDTGNFELKYSTGLSADFGEHAAFVTPEQPRYKFLMEGQAFHDEYEELEKKGLPIPPIAKKEGLKAISIIPIISNGATIACLNIATHSPSETPQFVKHALETIATQVGAAINRSIQEELLKNSEALFRNMFNSMTEGVAINEMIYNNSGVPINVSIVDVNPAYEKIMGRKREEVIGKQASEIYKRPSPDQIEIFKIFIKVVETGEPVSFTRTFEDGRTFRGSVFSLGKGRFISVFEDETEIKEARERQARAKTAMEVHAKVGAIAHDFANLLMGADGALQIALLDNPDSNTLKLGREAAQTMIQMNNELRDLTIAVKIPKMPMPIHDMIDAAINMAAPRKNASIGVTTNFQPNLRPIRYDKLKLARAIMNLLTNAYDAVGHRGKVIINASEVEVKEKKTTPLYEILPGKYIRIDIEDTGSGIQKDFLPKMFTLFESTKKGKGSGIGLSIVRTAIEAHGGYIEVKTSEKGTTFSIYLPIEAE